MPPKDALLFLQQKIEFFELHALICSHKPKFSSKSLLPLYLLMPQSFFFFHLLLLNNPPCRNLKIISTFTHQLAPSLLVALHFHLHPTTEKLSTPLSLTSWSILPSLYSKISLRPFPTCYSMPFFLPRASHLNPAICCQYHKQLLPLPDGICLAARPLLGRGFCYNL